MSISKPLPLVACFGLLLAAFVYGAVATARGWFPCSLWLPGGVAVRAGAAAAGAARTGDTADGELADGDTAAGDEADGSADDAGAGKGPRQRGAGPAPARPAHGMWRKAPPPRDAAPDAVDRDQLAAVPYLRGTVRAPEAHGVTVCDTQAAQPGLNLVVSAHAPEATLVDMRGVVLHRWHCDFERAFPGPLGFFEAPVNKTYWRRAHLFPNGDLLAIFEGIGMVKLDADSKLLWAYKGGCHHDLDVGPEGRIYTLARRLTRDYHRVPSGGPITEDFIVVLSPGGQELQRISLLDCLLDSPYACNVPLRARRADILHPNTIELLDGRWVEQAPMLRAGRVLVSCREISLVGVVDLQRARFEWAMTSLWRRQHQPTVIGGGHLLVFDNVGGRGKSRVLEVDPVTQEVVWSYGEGPHEELSCNILGSCARLANGDTLITDSVNGRAFEVTPDKRVVWEFVNPHRAGAHDELIATLAEVVRIDWSFPRFGGLRERFEHAGQLDDKGVLDLVEKLKK